MSAAVRGVVFDFDGVVVESGPIKRRAFLDLFPEHPELHAAIARHHESHLGVSRYEKIRWILGELLGRTETEFAVERLAGRFSELVLEETVACSPVPGARDSLEALRRAGIPAFVASGTPHGELEEIVARRHLADLFQEVWGSPHTKVAILEDLLDRYAIAPGDLVMVGDGRSDYDAALSVGARFVLRETPEQRPHFARVEVPRIPDLRPLTALLGLAPTRTAVTTSEEKNPSA